jgi:hypothetical protein
VRSRSCEPCYPKLLVSEKVRCSWCRLINACAPVVEPSTGLKLASGAVGVAAAACATASLRRILASESEILACERRMASTAAGASGLPELTSPQVTYDAKSGES